MFLVCIFVFQKGDTLYVITEPKTDMQKAVKNEGMPLQGNPFQVRVYHTFQIFKVFLMKVLKGVSVVV